MLATLVRFLLQKVALWETSQGEENTSFWEPLNYTDYYTTTKHSTCSDMVKCPESLLHEECQRRLSRNNREINAS